MIDLTIITSWIAANSNIVILILAVVLLIKGLALYKAAKKESTIWFWVILITNTLGILPLLYLVFSKGVNDGRNG